MHDQHIKVMDVVKQIRGSVWAEVIPRDAIARTLGHFFGRPDDGENILKEYEQWEEDQAARYNALKPDDFVFKDDPE